MPYPAPSQKGFTLIELLITMTVAGFLIIAGSLRVVDSRKNQMLRKAQMELKTGLEQAKNDAFYGKKPTGCVPFNGFNFSLNNNTGSNPEQYILYAQCGVAKTAVSSFDFDSGITIDTSIPDTEILFRSVNGGTDLASDMIFGITLDSTRTLAITLSNSGDVNASD